MYPHQLAQDVTHSERVVYESLRDGLPGDWRAIHGKRFVLPSEGAGRRATEGELDFLIMHPQQGVLALEVKGGAEVGRDDQGWYSIAHGQETEVRIKDPGKQVQEGAHHLLTHIRRRTTNPELTELSYCWGVAFPGMAIDQNKEMGTELPRPLVLDLNGLRDLQRTLEEMYSYWRRTTNQTQALSREASDELIRLLLPRFRFMGSLRPAPEPIGRLKKTIEAGETLILRQTEEQSEILEASSDNPRVSIKGAAGTGKTLVAFEKAKRLAVDGKKVLLLCFNQPLGDALQKKTNRFEVMNFHKLCRELIKGAGLSFNPPRVNATEFWEETAAEELLFVLEEDPTLRWDAVIVDEGQDFRTLWWIAIENLLKSQTESVLWVFHDPSQDLYGGGSIQALNLAPLKLSKNCRNTRNIAEKSYGFVGLQPKFREGVPDGIDVKEVVCQSDHEVSEALRKALHRLINEERLSNEDIVVLGPKSRQASSVWRRREFGNFKLVPYGEVQSPSEVSFSTIRRFKGLEANVVILCEVTDLDDPALLYVGASRAKHVLILIKSSN